MSFYVPLESTPQAQLPRFTLSAVATQQYVDDAVSSVQNQLQNGSNFRVLDGELQIKNTDQGKFTPVNTVGADGAQQLELQNTEI